jgi:hypothetical protein
MTLALPTLPVLLQRFFTQRLMQQKRVSAHTIRSYRDTFRLLLHFARKRLRTSPDRLAFRKDRRPVHLRVPERDRADTRCWCSHSQPPPDRHQVVLPLRCL